ncbi:MAG: alcohol dehydrogenase catalytic domain-containing protein [Microbacterium sp.]|uniref:alcohol dehydrogenase catalytic domain-containing protein n=1 Tax=Microbacterium sp. TaxID=51671 RepID=UPI001AD002C4|nr:alcohol dehydrogenase catalytic domain-containing protein [Microbacterium sp.]MBN9176562.1 alcohol dehydrogenase catalytic domain-containing protein [Microbacterium sp.]
MRAVIALGDGTVDVVEAAKPTLGRDTDAIVRVTTAAICGTDLGLLREPGRLPRGTILGHEFVGEVQSVGSAVRGIRPGMRVVACDYTACGLCWWCREGAHWHCPERRFFGTGEAFGQTLPGGQAEYVRVPFADTVLAEIPDGVSDRDAVFLGDLVPTGWAALERAGLRHGETVVITGGGPVGQVASLVAQATGAGPVIISEPDAGRRDVAAALGATAVSPGEAVGVVHEITSGRGADVVIDGVGGAHGLDAALSLVRSRGRICSVGVPHTDRWDAPVREAFVREVTLSFAVGDAIRDRDRFTPLVTAGLLTPSAVISGSAPLAGARDLYARAAAMTELKAVIEL